MGERGWVAGTVLRCFELPYLVALDQGGNVTAPADNDDLVRGLPHPDLPSLADDKGTPEGADLSMWKEFRFKVGDQVMANLGQQGFMRGRVRRISVKDTNDREAAYEIEIDPGGRMAYAPHDVEQIVRRCTPEEAAAMPKLRFKKGDRVVANMGQVRTKTLATLSPLSALSPFTTSHRRFISSLPAPLLSSVLPPPALLAKAYPTSKLSHALHLTRRLASSQAPSSASSSSAIRGPKF